MHTSRMNLPTILLLAVAAVALLIVVGCAPRGYALRPTKGEKSDPPDTIANGHAWYIESAPVAGKPASCSFVEFDERGDYLDFQRIAMPTPKSASSPRAANASSSSFMSTA